MRAIFIHCLFSLFIVFSQADAWAQRSANVDSLNADAVIDSTSIASSGKEAGPSLSSISVLYDYGKLVSGLALDTEFKQEVGVQLEFWNRLVVLGELGTAELEPTGAYQNGNYISEGTYYRLGVGYKHDMSAKNNIYLSFRFAQSMYEDSGEVEIESSPLYDRYVEPFGRTDQTAHWYEVVLSSERRLWKGLYAGFHARLRIMGNYNKFEPLDVYSIPGYGRTFDKTIPAFNLYIKYSLERF